MKTTILSLSLFILQACTNEESALDKFLKSGTPSFYAEISGEVAVQELGKTIRLVQGENASLLSSHNIAQPGVSQNSISSWTYLSEDGKAITVASPVFEYNSNTSIEEAFNAGLKLFDGSASGYLLYIYKNFTPYVLSTDAEGRIKNGKVEVLKYHLEPVTGLPYIGLYRYLAHVWLTLECDLYDTNGVKVGRLNNGRALCIFPIG